MKTLFLFVMLASMPLFSMEPMPRKRGAPESVEQLQGEPKTQKAEPIQEYPLASLPGLPNELKAKILRYLLTAPGKDDGEQLYNATRSIRNFFMSNKAYKVWLDDQKVTEMIIKELLAKRYTKNDLVAASISFGTNAANIWLANLIARELMNPDGSFREKLNHDQQLLQDNLYRALMYAVDHDRFDILRFLLTAQPALANWHVTIVRDGEPDRIPLLEAALSKENMKMVDFLLKYKPQITSAIVMSAATNLSPLGLQALKKAGVDLKARYENEPLITLAVDEKVIAYLVAEGADINAKNSSDETVLEQALVEKNFALVPILLKYGADPNIQNESSMTALHTALYQNADINSVRNIVEKMTNLDVKDHYGNTPLAIAILTYNLDAIKLLLARGALLPQQIYDNFDMDLIAYSPLAFLLRMPLYDNPQILMRIIELVVAHGADVNEIITDPRTGSQVTLLKYLESQDWSPTLVMLKAFLKAKGASV